MRSFKIRQILLTAFLIFLFQIANLNGSLSLAQTSQSAADLSASEKISLAQSLLRAQDYYHGSINGRLTSSTQKALKKFQEYNSLRKTGQLDLPTIKRLGLESSIVSYRENLTGSANVSSNESIAKAQRILHDRRYYSGPIDGQLTWETQKAIKEFQDDKDLEKTGRLDLPTTEALGLNIYTVSYDGLRVINYDLDSFETVAFVQRVLQDQKYYIGPVNGEMTVATRESLKRYQAEHRLTVTGNLDPATAEMMGLKPVKVPYEKELTAY